jgi:hypothetical protein
MGASKFSIVIGFISAFALTACSPKSESPNFNPSNPVVLDLKTNPVASESGMPAVEGQLTLAKNEILNREFLYGADLQYSSMEDGGMMQQAIATGHFIAKFRVMNNRLQLFADQKHLFQSDINHPERLINEFPILSQDEKTLTISIRKASPILVTIAGDKKSAKARASWVRSVEYAQQGNYLLIESSIEQADGTVAEFMESVFPRDTIVKADSAAPILMDGELEPLADRFRFLSNEKIWMDHDGKRVQTEIANHYPINKSSGVIDWYVTRNVPAEYLTAIKAGVEGWNRYSRKMWNRDIVQFKGLLPEGVKIGDPRYNVINWDSVPDATSAYESQAADPITGLQSHSLIYLPYAWVKVGLDYWKDANKTQTEIENANAKLKKALDNGSILGSPLHVRCFHDLDLVASLDARRSAEAFAKGLLKQTLFHEMGHALGLAHNFKGSLSFDTEKPETLFSTSIMDYNQYQIEDNAFDAEESANGPILEYDRQILSALYNRGADITKSDMVVPTCNDEEADNTEGGYDPLCIRYDAGSDPTVELQRTVRLVTDENYKLGRTQSLVMALRDSAQALGSVADVKTSDDVDARVKAFTEQLNGTVSFYYVTGAQSLGRMAIANIRALYTFNGELPAPYDADKMRARVKESLDAINKSDRLEDSTRAEFKELAVTAQAWLKQTPWFATLDATQQAKALETVETKTTDLIGKLETSIFPRLHKAIAGSLVRVEKAPFFFGEVDGQSVDFERYALDTLETSLTKAGAGKLETRLAAAKSLLTFKELPEAKEIIARSQSKLRTELSSVKNAEDREAVRGIIKALQE